MNIKVKIECSGQSAIKNGKSKAYSQAIIGQMDMDGDIFTEYPIEETSNSFEDLETGKTIHVADIYDIFKNHQIVHIFKL
jgi:hypothetical protein